MRINKFVAQASGLSRRAADAAIQEKRVKINDKVAELGDEVNAKDTVTLDGKPLQSQADITIMFHKPAGYVSSRDGQGSRTIYDLLPEKYHKLKPIGRLDKGSSGLLLLTNDGSLAYELTHPKFQKTKVYEIELDKPLAPLHRQMINDYGVKLADGPSKLLLERIKEGNDKFWKVTMSEGRNRQIRRTFDSLGYTVVTLHRTHFGPYRLEGLDIAKVTVL